MTAAEQIMATARRNIGKAAPLKLMRHRPNTMTTANEVQMPKVPITRAVLSIMGITS